MSGAPTGSSAVPPTGRRVEDGRLLTGRGRYVADIQLPGALSATFVRSPYAHARLLGVDAGAAASLRGVSAVLAADALPPVTLQDRNKIPGLKRTPQPVLAVDRVRFVGEPVALVLAESRYLAEDGAELVDVRYEELPPAVDAERDRTTSGRTPLFEELPDDLVYTGHEVYGDPAGEFERADHVFEAVYRQGRAAAVPLEGRGCIAEYEPSSRRLSFWCSTQGPHLVRKHLAAATGLAEHQITVHTPDVGGAFGQKIPVHPEEIAVALASMRVGAPVKWIEDRRENLLAATHAKEQMIRLELAVSADGTFRALRARIVGDAGAYSFNSASALIEPYLGAKLIPGVYRIESYEYELDAVLTNKAPVAPYRGVGWTAAQTAREILIDKAARGLGRDPVELRLQNMIGADEFPYRSCTGLIYDSGSYRESLRRAAEMLDYDAFRHEQREARADGRCLGVGVSPYVEPTGWGTEGMKQMGWWAIPSADAARVSMDPSGTMTVSVATASQGQGHETVLAQIAADVVGVPAADAVLAATDTSAAPIGAGTRASRMTVVAGGAIARAATELREKLLRVAAAELEASPADLEIVDAAVRVRGSPSRTLTIREVAYAAYYSERVRAAEPEPDLSCTRFYDPNATYSNGCILAVVEVDRETGGVQVRRLVGVEDCGTVINPVLVEGQFVGGIAQGLGVALLERVVYDAGGQIQTSTLMDYLIPTSTEMPAVEIDHLCSPSPHTWRGVKGMAESGTIGAPAAIANAVADALAPFGAEVETLPLQPEQVRGLVAPESS